MEFVELLVENVERAQERFLSVLEGLSLEEVNAFPLVDTVPSIKSITWLTWHTARELDFQMIRKIGITLLKKRIKLW